MGICYAKFKRKYNVDSGTEYITPAEVRIWKVIIYEPGSGKTSLIAFLEIEFEDHAVVKCSPFCTHAALFKLVQVTKKLLENNVDPDQTEYNNNHNTSTLAVDAGYVTLEDIRRHESTYNTYIGEVDPPTTSDVQDDDDEHRPAPCIGPRTHRLSFRIKQHRGLIENIVDVEEVIPFLPFIVDREITSNRNISPRHRVRLLLDSLDAITVAEKWEAFLSALRQSDYTHLLEKITGENTDDHVIYRDILRQLSPRIIDRVRVTDIIHHLYERTVLNMQDLERIMAEDKNNGNKSACFVMVNLIPRRSSDWYENFKQVLLEFGMEDVVDEMKELEISAALRQSTEILDCLNKNLAATQSDNFGSEWKGYDKLLISDPYNEPNSEESRLWVLRQELRNIVHNMKDKKINTERAKHILHDIRQIPLEVLEYIGCEVCCAANNHDSLPDITRHKPGDLHADNDVTQLGGQKNGDVVKRNGEYRELLTRIEQSLSDLTESVRNQSVCVSFESFPTCSLYRGSDSAFFSSSMSVPDSCSCPYTSIITHM